MSSTCFEVIHEDQQLLVVNKHASVATMGVGSDAPCLLSEAKQYLSRSGIEPNRFAAVVGRLDYHVSGVVVVAKDPLSADHLRRQQERGGILKIYHALVAGSLEPPMGEVTHSLLKSKRRRSVSVVTENTTGSQLAKLQYKVLQKTEEASLLSIRLLTGRKHQIRVQLSHLGHPILGDIKYRSPIDFPKGIALICKRIALRLPIDESESQWEVDYPDAWSATFARFGLEQPCSTFSPPLEWSQ